MLLALDIGNTNIVMAIHDGKKWIENWRARTDTKKTTDEYFLTLRELFNSSDQVETKDIEGVIVSSVVPNLSRSFEKAIFRLCGKKPLMVSHKIETGLIKESIPVELGYDIMCNLSAAHKIFPDKTNLILDFGTCLTSSVVDEEGNVLGCAITPGLITSVNCLASNTAQLPQIELKLPETVLGRNSQDSIRAGIMYGFAGLSNSLINQAEKELNKPLNVLATGGLCYTISELIPRINYLDKNLTLEGLRIVWEKNK